jgi:hypothetical protein
LNQHAEVDAHGGPIDEREVDALVAEHEVVGKPPGFEDPVRGRHPGGLGIVVGGDALASHAVRMQPFNDRVLGEVGSDPLRIVRIDGFLPLIKYDAQD